MPLPQLPLDKTLAALRTLFADPSLTLIGQNLKYDLMVLANYGLRSHNRLADTMLASYLLNPTQRHNLNDLAQEHLGYTMLSYEDVTEGAKKNFADVSVAGRHALRRGRRGYDPAAGSPFVSPGHRRRHGQPVRRY